MQILRTVAAMQRACRRSRRPLAFVPTMGALHEGHLSLIRRARKAAGKDGAVAVSIFVNPTQFGPAEDFSKYPRTLRQDVKLCREHGVDLVFTPTPEDMYPAGFSTFVEETALEGALCGKSRPGHFRGVCTVVAKLFNLLAPDFAVFGEKDFQQLAIIRRMVRDLCFQTQIIGTPTVREADGLALSSRNRYLTDEERAQAPTIRAALLKAAGSGRSDPEALRRMVKKAILTAPAARIDYVEVVDPDSLTPARRNTNPKLIATAVLFGRTRLIDNILVQ